MAEMRSYKIATINLNAVTNETKLNALKSFIRVSELDIIFLQEVAVRNLDIPGFNIEYNVDERRRGTAIAVRNYFSYGNVDRSLDSRIISLRISGITLINVYAPAGSQNRNDRESFFNTTLSHYFYNASNTVVIGGDFNSVVNQKDATGTNSHSPMLHRFMSAADVADSWEILNPRNVEFSFIRADSASRIDRIIITKNMSGWVRTAYFAATAFSDHKAYIIRTVLPILGSPPGRGLWRMHSNILDQPEVIEELTAKWSYWTRFRRNYRSWIDWWIHFVKPKLASFLKWKTSAHNRSFHDTMELYYAMLRSAYDRYFGDRSQLQTINHVKGLMLNLQRQHRENTRRRNDIYIGGENTSIFHVANQKKKRSESQITRIDTAGGVTTNAEVIQQHVFQYFENLYSPSQIIEDGNFDPARRIPDGNQENQQILREITPEEILKAIKSSASKKSPGIDGLPKEFYIKTWRIISREFTHIINEAMAGQAPKEFFDGVIVLVKKKGGSSTIKGYRPISLLNVDYKLLSRIIKQRMVNLLPFVLSEKQKCSNGRRNIFEATARIYDRICEVKHRNESALLVAFDLDHAFDRVEYGFLESTMEKMNFNPNLIQLLTQFARNSNSRALINGRLSQEIKIQRSVRQGDPLAMFLFVLYLQPLIDKLTAIFPHIVLNAYADDISMFIRNEQQLNTVLQIFLEFERVSGAILNTSKTISVMLGRINLTADSNWLKRESMVKILGITFAEDPENIVEENWKNVIQGFQKRLWINNGRHLNLVQKVILVNTYISSKLWYTASILPLPNKYAGKLISRIGSFLWYGKPWTRIAFETLVLPKQRGGLNLHSPPIKARALLVNRMMVLASELPFYWSYMQFNANPPFVSGISKKYEHIRTVIKEAAFLPEEITRVHCSSSIYNFSLQRMKDPKIIRENPNRNWKKIFQNIHSTQLTSHLRATWFMIVHHKVLTNELLFKRNRRADPICNVCPGVTDTVDHHILQCSENGRIWRHQRRQFIAEDRRLSNLQNEDWIYPVLNQVNRQNRHHFLKTFCLMLCYILETNLTDRSIDDYRFYLACNI